MSIYRMGAGGYDVPPPPTEDQRPRAKSAGEGQGPVFVPPIVLGPAPESGFWTLIKYVGAGLTIWVGYEKLKELYDRNLANKAADTEDEGAE